MDQNAKFLFVLSRSRNGPIHTKQFKFEIICVFFVYAYLRQFGFKRSLVGSKKLNINAENNHEEYMRRPLISQQCLHPPHTL